MQSAIIIGVGPLQGLGAQLCRRFAHLGLHVHVAGRTEIKLKDAYEFLYQQEKLAWTFELDLRTAIENW